tara:strand:+ start:72 stop:875 length:804 start_codon:yes stop_codon:yes gene_type:complete
MLTLLIRAIKTGKNVTIVTFNRGNPEDIRDFLRVVAKEDLDDTNTFNLLNFNIFSRDSSRDPLNKNYFIDLAANSVSIRNPEDIILIDDDETNCEKAQKVGIKAYFPIISHTKSSNMQSEDHVSLPVGYTLHQEVIFTGPSQQLKYNNMPGPTLEKGSLGTVHDIGSNDRSLIVKFHLHNVGTYAFVPCSIDILKPLPLESVDVTREIQHGITRSLLERLYAETDELTLPSRSNSPDSLGIISDIRNDAPRRRAAADGLLKLQSSTR